MEGLGKIEVAVVGSEAEGPYELLWGAMLHSPYTPSHPHPKNLTTPISKPPPQKPEEAVPEASTPVVEDVKQALEAAPPALEVAIPTHMAPFHLQLGGIKRLYKC